MNNRKILIFLVIDLILSVGIILYLVTGQDVRTQDTAKQETVLDQQMETGDKYILYIGTNDKDTYTQLIPTEEARDKVNAICARYVDGYTASDARGGWVDETDTLTQENTLVYSFYGVTNEQLKMIMDDVLVELNQNSILVEKQSAVYTYYSGE
ncbi:MAG: DUF3574 domain-containing protein [Lachnospiraceae bacterium]|nr:DUF3574 domain-containing protein [Lachnospiraceae bacterium]MBQ9233963.1 DUF3574 domain-containing protein [Lachnospiraceae bacterium]